MLTLHEIIKIHRTGVSLLVGGTVVIMTAGLYVAARAGNEAACWVFLVVAGAAYGLVIILK